MIRVATNSLAEQAPNRGAGEDDNGTLVGVSGSALAPDGAAEGVTKGASGVLRPYQRRGSDLRVRWREDFSHLFDGHVGCWIGDAGSVEEKLSVQGSHCQAAHESESPGRIWVEMGMWGVSFAVEAQARVRSTVADQWQRRSRWEQSVGTPLFRHPSGGFPRICAIQEEFGRRSFRVISQFTDSRQRNSAVQS